MSVIAAFRYVLATYSGEAPSTCIFFLELEMVGEGQSFLSSFKLILLPLTI